MCRGGFALPVVPAEDGGNVYGSSTAYLEYRIGRKQRQARHHQIKSIMATAEALLALSNGDVAKGCRLLSDAATHATEAVIGGEEGIAWGNVPAEIVKSWIWEDGRGWIEISAPIDPSLLKVYTFAELQADTNGTAEPEGE
jgi:hypothetical protein